MISGACPKRNISLAVVFFFLKVNILITETAAIHMRFFLLDYEISTLNSTLLSHRFIVMRNFSILSNHASGCILGIFAPPSPIAVETDDVIGIRDITTLQLEIN